MIAWGDIIGFVGTCERAKVEPPASVVRALALLDVIREHRMAPTGGLLSMSDDDARDRLTALEIRRDRMEAAQDTFEAELLHELAVAVRPELDALVESVQLSFETLSRPLVVGAQDFGFTWRTTSDEIILRADERASQAWRDSAVAWSAISSIVLFRHTLSRVFAVAPATSAPGEYVDYSVAFAAGDNWSDAGEMYVERNQKNTIDWFALGLGGLRLNTPTDVTAKQNARADNPVPHASEGDDNA